MLHNTKLSIPLNKVSLNKYTSCLNATAISALKPFQKTVSLLNTGAWNIANDNYSKTKSINEHVRYLGKRITIIKRMLPQTDIIWRGTTTTHVHKGSDIERLIYVSNNRVKVLNDAQL